MRPKTELSVLSDLGIEPDSPEWERFRILARILSVSTDGDLDFSAEFQDGLRNGLMLDEAKKSQSK